MNDLRILVTEIILINDDTKDIFKIRKDLEDSDYMTFGIGNSVFEFPIEELGKIFKAIENIAEKEGQKWEKI